MRAPILALALVAISLPAFPRQQQTISKPPPAPRLTGFRAEFIADLDEVQDKIEKLAAAVRAEKYAWRPAPGIRSVSEVYMHIAGGNYFLPTFVGQQPPADMPKDIEKIADKAAVLAEMKKS